MMTKQEFKAAMQLAANLKGQYDDLICVLSNKIGFNGFEGAVLNNLDDVAKMMSEGLDCSTQLEANASSLPDGNEIVPPSIAASITYGTPIVAVKYPAGEGAFIAETGTSGYGTRSISMQYDLDKDTPAQVGKWGFDICFAEVKKGDLAEVHGYDTDNNDIDVFVYKDAYVDDYTDNFQLKYSDMESVLDEEE